MEPADLQHIAIARETVKENPNVAIDDDAVVIHPDDHRNGPCSYVAAWVKVQPQHTTEYDPAARV